MTLAEVGAVPSALTDAERDLMAVVLYTGARLPDVARVLRPDDFGNPRFRAVWEAVLSLDARGDAVDAGSVAIELERRSDPTVRVGRSDLVALANETAVAGALPTYVRHVQEAAERRRMREAGTVLLQAADQGDLTSARDRVALAVERLSTHRPQDVAARMPLRDRMLTLSQLGALPPLRPLVDGLLYRNTLAQLSGQPGSYKSFAGIALSAAVALGRSFEGHRVPEAGAVVYAAAEGGSGLQTRVLAWCELANVDPADLEAQLLILPGAIQLGDNLDVTEAAGAARDLGAALVVLDTRARSTLGLDENSATDQGLAIAAAERIQQQSGATVLGIHHSGRGGDHGRGSNAWDGAVWSDLRMKGEELRCVIHCEKHKDVPDGCDHHYRLVPHTVSEHLMPAREGEDPIDYVHRRATLVLAQTGHLDDLVGDRKSTRVVLDVVRTSALDTGLTQPQIVALSQEKDVSRSAAYEAVKALVSNGALRNVATGKTPRYVANDTTELTGGTW